MTVEPPAGLEEGGSLLWESLAAEGHVTGSLRPLALEACRVADRLDRLAALLEHDADAKVLGEARQQGLALKALLAQLAAAPAQGATTTSKGPKSDQLSARRAARIAAAQAALPT